MVMTAAWSIDVVCSCCYHKGGVSGVVKRVSCLLHILCLPCANML
jgi:hypothetical protein